MLTSPNLSPILARLAGLENMALINARRLDASLNDNARVIDELAAEVSTLRGQLAAAQREVEELTIKLNSNDTRIVALEASLAHALRAIVPARTAIAWKLLAQGFCAEYVAKETGLPVYRVNRLERELIAVTSPKQTGEKSYP